MMFNMDPEHRKRAEAFDDFFPNESDQYTDYCRFVDIDNDEENFVRQYLTFDAAIGKWTGAATHDLPSGFDSKCYDIPGEYDTPEEVIAIHDREFPLYLERLK